MSKLSDDQKKELLEDAYSQSRKNDFRALRESTEQKPLTPQEYIEFLDWAQQFMKEDPSERPPMTGDHFLM